VGFARRGNGTKYLEIRRKTLSSFFLKMVLNGYQNYSLFSPQKLADDLQTLGVHTSDLSRELRRNAGGLGYSPNNCEP
jgi:hypothetical protein